MKVCFVINKLSFFLSHRLDLATEIAKKHSFFLITDLTNCSKKEKKMLSSCNIETIHLSQRSKADGWKGWFRYLFGLAKILKRSKPHYIFYITLELSILGSLLHNFIGGKKSFFLITGLSHHLTSNNFKLLIRRIFQQILNPFLYLQKDHLFVFQNNNDRMLFIKKNMAYKNKTMVIRGSGVNDKVFKLVNRQSEEQVVFLFAARLIISKGIQEFIDASIALKKKYPQAIFRVAGPYDSEDPESISKDLFHNFPSEIEYIGSVNYLNVCEMLSDASVFVLPSYGEGLPKAALEAGLTGLPLILTDVSGCKDCIDSKSSNGFLVKAHDAIDLEEKMEKLIMNKELRLRQGISSNKYISKTFGNSAIQKDYLELLEN